MIKSRHKLTLLTLVICLAVLWQCWPKPAPVVTVPEVHFLYLPLILTPRLTLRGVGLSSPDYGDVEVIEAAWWDTWLPWGPPSAPECDLGFVPMIPTDEDWPIGFAIEKAWCSSGFLLGFNEPDLFGMTPLSGAQKWREIETLAADIQLVSPAPSQHDPDWLWRMVDEYQARYGKRPRFDAIAWHIYTNAPTVAKEYLTKRHDEASQHGYNVEVWVTEWAGVCTAPDPLNGNERMVREMIPWFEDTEWIERYAWFASRIREDEPWGQGWHSCSLVNPNTGKLTELGNLYRGY